MTDHLDLTPMTTHRVSSQSVEARLLDAERKIQENLRRIEEWSKRIDATIADHEARITTTEDANYLQLE